MTITQDDIQSLQQAIRQLSRREREELAEWILNSSDFELEVREAALQFGPHGFMAVEEYLSLEEEWRFRYEYVAGQVFAMTSPTNRHEIVVSNLVGHFHSQLRGTPCRVFSSNARVRLKVDTEDIFYMPDVLVSCGPFGEALNERYLTNPCIVVEVLSPSTESIDRREKALNYRHMPSLEEYLLIAPRTLQVTVFRRSENWKPQVLTTAGDVYESHAVEVNIPLVDIYEGTQ